MFRNSVEKSCNIELLIEREEKRLIKTYGKIDKNQLDNLVNAIATYQKTQFEFIPDKLYKNEGKDLIDLAKEDIKLLSEIFDINNLYHMLDCSKNELTDKFKEEYEFRRRVLGITLYKILSKFGKEKGPEYGLLFAKIHNLNIALPMTYASYNGMFDEKFLKFFETYKSIGGPSNIYWLPNYYDNDPKSKYNMEDLSELGPQLEKYISKKKINSKK